MKNMTLTDDVLLAIMQDIYLKFRADFPEIITYEEGLEFDSQVEPMGQDSNHAVE